MDLCSGAWNACTIIIIFYAIGIIAVILFLLGLLYFFVLKRGKPIKHSKFFICLFIVFPIFILIFYLQSIVSTQKHNQDYQNKVDYDLKHSLFTVYSPTYIPAGTTVTKPGVMNSYNDINKLISTEEIQGTNNKDWIKIIEAKSLPVFNFPQKCPGGFLNISVEDSSPFRDNCESTYETEKGRKIYYLIDITNNMTYYTTEISNTLIQLQKSGRASSNDLQEIGKITDSFEPAFK